MKKMLICLIGISILALLAVDSLCPVTGTVTGDKMAILRNNIAKTSAEEKKITDEYYETEYWLGTREATEGRQSMLLMSNNKTWRKGNSERVDTEMLGAPLFSSTTLKVDGKEYSISPLGGKQDVTSKPISKEAVTMTKEELEQFSKAMNKFTKDMRVIGQETISGRTCYIVMVTEVKDEETGKKTGEYMKAWYDSSTGYPVKTEVKMINKEDGKAFISTSISSDFYVHNEHLIRPGKTKMYWNGTQIGMFVFKNYKLNKGISDVNFSSSAIERKYEDIKNEAVGKAGEAAAEGAKDAATDAAKNAAEDAAKDSIMHMFGF